MYIVEGSLPFLGMVMVVLAQVTSMVASKVAMSKGLSNLVIIVYSNAISAFILLPLSLLFQRSDHLPPLTFSIIWRVLLLAFSGFLVNLSGYAGLKFSSPMLASAILNLTPAFTCILAVIFRMETLDYGSKSSKVKLVGIIVSVGGAFVVTFYKGPPIPIPIPHSFSGSAYHKLLHLPPQPHHWILGGFYLAFEALGISFMYIIQASILKRYPAELTIVFFFSLFVTVQSTAVALVAERDATSWRLRCDMVLFAVLYTGVIGTVLRNSLCSWCLRKKGALYASMFKPLGVIIALVLGVLFLGDLLFLGSLIGALVIVVGFYAVMWGKAKEEKVMKDSMIGKLESSSSSSSSKVPLLPNNSQDV